MITLITMIISFEVGVKSCILESEEKQGEEKMRKLIALAGAFVIAFSSPVLGGGKVVEKREFYTSSGIKVEDVEIPSDVIVKNEGKSGWDVEAQGCSVMGKLYQELSLTKNLDALKEAFTNWKKLALPVTIYTLALQFPYVKDALVSAQYMSDFLAQIGGTSCEQAFDFINRVNGVDKEAVAECYNRVFSKGGVCTKASDPNKCFLEHCGVHKSWYELATGKAFSDLIKDKKALAKVNEVFTMVNPKTTMECALGLDVPVEDMSEEDFNRNSQTVAEKLGTSQAVGKAVLALLYTLPEVKVSSKGLGIETAKIDGKVLSLSRSLDLIQKDLISDFNDLITGITTATPEEIKKKVEELSKKYGLNLSGADSYFVIMKYVKEKLDKDCPVKDGVLSPDAPDNCAERISAFEQAQNLLSQVIAYEYAKNVEVALIDYINRTKQYLLNANKTGLAVCSKVKGKKIDLSPESVKTQLAELDAIIEQLRTTFAVKFGSYNQAEINRMLLQAVKDFAYAGTGREYKEGDRVNIVLTKKLY